MTTSKIASPSISLRPGADLLRRSGLVWFCIAAVGQTAFIWMILAHFGRRTLIGDFAGWNDKPLIKGYAPGDDAGNLMFAVHVLLAAVVTLSGLMQLVPALRRRAPGLHRWNGRVFLTTAVVMALGGLWLTWGRGTYLSLISAIAVSVDGILILIFGTLAWRTAVRRDFGTHQRWAMRAFLAVNGVWFLRVGLMAWAIATGGLGMNNTLSGPADVVLQFGAYLIPLALFEAYWRAGRSTRPAVRLLVITAMALAAAVTALGVFGAVAFMWGPYML
ncbi:DUF2306 domain-containing protein [Brevundimonas pondensis]|uniref:DUF2306 domain-containing protein n=1 Tax=Brevundimonas pondensis TaxID=2774189 RepID=UPI0028D1EF31|nr:DUF2306 domain-containing protein [uncultured Brevundimonas sp.]